MAELASSYIPNHVTTMFNRNFGFDVQQMVARLRPFVTIESDEIPGNGKRYDDLGARANMEQMTGRAVPTRRRQSTSSSRWLFVQPYDDAEVVGRFDPSTIGRITNPQSDIAKAIDMARNRTADALILASVNGTVYTGTTGQTPLTFSGNGGTVIHVGGYYDPTTHVWTESGTLPLNVSKIRKALEALGTNEVLEGGMAGANGERPVLALRAKDKNALFHEIVVTSKDYGERTPYSDGVLESFLGVTLVHTEQLTTGSSIAQCLMWLPSAIYFKEQNWANYIDVLPEQSHAVQIRTEGQMGAMRRYDKKVVQINVVE